MTKKRDPRDTPAMRQYARFKSQYTGCILFFRMGDFYEMFDEDAKIAHKELGLTLTSRNGNIPMAGMPHHASQNYIKTLIEKGYRIALCEQLEEPTKGTSLVKRGVVQVLTPGTLVDENLLNDSKPNVLAAYYEEHNEAWISTAELSTGQFNIITCKKQNARDILIRTSTCELLTSDQNKFSLSHLPEISITKRESWWFDPKETRALLCDHFKLHNLSSLELENDPRLSIAPGALLRYLLETQAGDKNLKFLKRPSLQSTNNQLILDEVTLNNLEVLKGGRENKESLSLLGALPRPITSMGRRKLRSWLTEPLCSKSNIEIRHDAVEALLNSNELRSKVKNLLDGMGDIPRMIGRLSMRRCTPRDLIALGESMRRQKDLIAILNSNKKIKNATGIFENQSNEIDLLGIKLAEALVKTPPTHTREGGLIQQGFDSNLDDLRNIKLDVSSWLANYQQEISKKTGINSIKIGHNKIFGYYIEVSNAKKTEMTNDFTRTQTLKNAERYTTPALASFQQRIESSTSQSINRELFLIKCLEEEIMTVSSAMRKFSEIISTIDCLYCFSEYANIDNLTRPKMTSKPILEISQGRHPILGQTIQNFIPNDCFLKSSMEPASTALITGPNMAGKSTYLRQNALIILLAQAGSFVPAKKAVIGITDRIFTRIGSGDDLHQDRSTFMVEMSESATILNQATLHSFIILDEIGRGTSTLDGLAIAWSFTEAISSIEARCLFATHYHELTDVAEKNNQLCNLNIVVRESGDNVVFIHRIAPGTAQGSYGIHVAKIAGIPEKTIQRAREILNNLNIQTDSSENSYSQPFLFCETDSELSKKILNINLDSLSPLEAFDEFRQLQKYAEDINNKK